MLKIEDPVAVLARRGAQQLQRVGMAIEKIRVLAQVGHNVASADLGRTRSGGAAGADRLRFVLRSVGHV